MAGIRMPCKLGPFLTCPLQHSAANGPCKPPSLPLPPLATHAGCSNLSVLKLQCPNLQSKIPQLKSGPQHVKPSHPPIATMLKENLADAAHKAAETKERDWANLIDDSIIPRAFRPF